MPDIPRQGSYITQEGKSLSDLIGAHQVGDFVTEVMLVSAASPILDRGSVVARKADGTVTLAGEEATTPAMVYGISLDFAVVPTPASEGLSTCTVARSGVYSALSLIVGGNGDLRPYVDQLRLIGIFLEKVPLWVTPTPPPPPPPTDSPEAEETPTPAPAPPKPKTALK